VKKGATELSSKTLDPTPSPGSICWEPLAKSLHLPSLCRAGNRSGDLLRRGSAVLLHGHHVSATLYKGLAIFTWLTRYNIMLKRQNLRDSSIIMNYYFVLEMEMVSTFEHQFAINVFLKVDKI